MTHLVAHDLTVRWGQETILDRISLSARAGELICILGPNGAGKSTLLRALSGALKATGVQIDGCDLNTINAKQRARLISWLPQNGQAAWPLPTRAIIALGRLPHGVTLDTLTPRDEAAINTALIACDLHHLADRDVTTLSGGERARALLARALAVEAPVLLADEPVSALDPQHQLSVMNVLRAETQRGRLAIVVLHDLTLAARFADRIILMRKGCIAADAAPSLVLTPDLLGDVFGVEIAQFERDGAHIVVPWAAR